MLLIVGDHDVTQATETSYTKTLVIAKVIQHESFNLTNNDNDIALIFPANAITFNAGVGPSCLPTA